MTRATVQSAIFGSFQGHPDAAIAIDQGDRLITYRQLDRAVNRLAAKLVRLGTARGSVVAVLTHDRIQVIVAALAVLKARGIFALLDPAHPARYLAAQLSIAQPRLILVDGGTKDNLGACAGLGDFRCEHLDAMLEDDGTDPDDAVAWPEYDADDPVYIYFTSGTTGTPKAILGRNGSLLHFLQWEICEFALPETVRVSQLTSPSHDPFLRDALMPLLAGGTICVPPDKNVVLGAAALKSWLTSASVNLVHCTPTVFRNLCTGQLSDQDFPALRWMVVAGEKLRGLDVSRWFSLFGSRTELINLYGPTETTLAKFFHRVTADDANSSVVPIGRPIADTDYRVRGRDRDCEVGEAGELYIRTDHGSLGYYNAAPGEGDEFDFGEKDVRLVYRTGDFVRRRSDGSLEFVERRDRQIKIAGERVQLEEIEGKIAHALGVSDCYVRLDGNDGDRPDRLVAYIVGNDGDGTEAARSLISLVLPAAQVPTHFIRVDALPIKVNGKLDESLLPPAGSAAEKAAAPSANDIPAVLTGMWQQILGVDEIGSNDAFMDSGGDSLKIMLLIGQLDDQFGYELSLWDVFDNLTIDVLARKISDARSVST